MAMSRVAVLGCCVGAVAGVAWAQADAVAAAPSPFAKYMQSAQPGDTGADPICHECVGCGKAWAARNRFTQENLQWLVDPRGELAMREAYGDTDVLACNLDIEFIPNLTTPANGTLTGSNTFTIRSLVNGLTEFTFRLRSQYTGVTATMNGSTPATITNVSTTTRRVTLDRAYNAGEQFTLRITYTGIPVNVGLGSINLGTQGGQPLAWTLSQPYYAYTWWPCKDGDVGQPGDTSDKFLLTFALTVPNTLTAVANGLLQGTDDLSGGRRRFRYASQYAIPTYLVAFGITNYNFYRQTYTYPLSGGGTASMPVDFYYYPGSDTFSNRNTWEISVQMLEAFRGVYGLYPFINERYGMYQFGFSGGMEHQTMTGQGVFSESVTAHELAHQWWGDWVTCRTWSDIWLNEGGATYGEAVWQERRSGSTGLPALFSAMNSRRPSQTGANGSVYVYDTSSINTIFNNDLSYRKGAWTYHQLRKLVGDAVFWQILANWRSSFGGSSGTTNDFIGVVNSTTGQNYQWFFDQCVFGTGAPVYQFGWNTFAVNGQNYLRLHVQQTQSTAFGSGGRFRFPMDLRVNFASGSTLTSILNDARLEHYVVPISSPATGVTLDENRWILEYGKTNVAYVNGPPKLIQTSPAPGSQFAAAAAPSALTVTFSENVNISAANVTVTRNGTAVPFTLAYTPGTFSATLTFSGPLAPGGYSVTVSTAVTSVAAGIALDGEVADPNAPGSLPSGDGQPGGAAAFGFTVLPQPCPGDADGNGAVGANDLSLVLASFGLCPGDPNYIPGANLDGNPCIGANDLSIVLANWGCGLP
ncbi:MAG: Ig-like domain-containing protein [Phycisphaerales bacterium]|nr:Ig-like domain-containing protein [Phycisphaerales bacterium]